MAVADIVLSKPAASQPPKSSPAALRWRSSTPSWAESRNSDFLLENGAAIKINNEGTLAMKLSQLLDDPKRLESLKDQRPDASPGRRRLLTLREWR